MVQEGVSLLLVDVKEAATLVVPVFSSNLSKRSLIRGRAIQVRGEDLSGDSREEDTESSTGSLQLLSMCLFIDDAGTLAWQIGHST